MTRPAAALDRAGEGRVYPLPDPETGEILELPSVTRVISVADPLHLCDWKSKMRLLGVAMREDIAVQVAAAHLLPAGPPRNSELRRLADLALEAGQVVEKGHIPSDRGTGYHSLVDRLDDLVAPGDVRKVDELGLPRPVAEIAKAYVDAMKGVVVKASEITVCSFTHGYAGTADRLLGFEPIDPLQAAFDQYNLDNGTFCSDNKFGLQMKPTFALQLAALVNAEHIWDPEAREYRPLPDDLRRDIGFVFAPDVGLVPVDLEGAWEAFLGALAIHQFNALDPLHAPLRAQSGKVNRSGGSVHLEDLGARQGSQSLGAGTGLSMPPSPPSSPEVADGSGGSGTGPSITSRPVGSDDPFAGLPNEDGLPQIDRAAKREWLLERITALADVTGGLAALAARWPAGVPTFKTSTDHTVTDLEQIERAVVDAEAAVTAPFPARSDPTDPNLQIIPATDERYRQLHAALEALPRDLAAQTRGQLRAVGNILRPTEAQYPEMRQLVAAAIARNEARAHRVDAAVAVAAEKGADEDVLWRQLGVTGRSGLNSFHVEVLDEIVDAVNTGVVVARDRRLVVDRPAAVLANYDNDRGKVLTAGRKVAKVRGHEPPRDSDAVLADVELVAALLQF